MPCSIEGTDLIWVWSLTAVNARIATSIVCAKSGESIVLAMFSDPRLHEMSLPTLAYDKSSLNNDGVDTCRISEHRLLCVILPSIGLARLTVSSNMI
ncbi:Uncharacterised protein [Mycobacterium tuberculosis]|uniref:Uncharacterized protein n=1 Tax=Mycobacterium tuberculosis TaxID=1773 RepID=A0A655JQU8_MYCTX|nr:Uncharacterised protein [Mycobacterium tuberculosis]CNU30414.1 Uncharacterised protein [Mycobacterium tuberculosis]CNV72069.1 Uncharacterised protein [Mycobacterium tuberculosis]COX44808.1 Uncharacterised protein [Mycobacterium tuberculosis]COX91684.1 Uncharacterised protein [Mycobacterium tuberculosis]